MKFYRRARSEDKFYPAIAPQMKFKLPFCAQILQPAVFAVHTLALIYEPAPVFAHEQEAARKAVFVLGVDVNFIFTLAFGVR